MKKTGIMTDSHSGILNEEAERLGIKVLPMPFYIGEKVYREGVDLSRDEFYDMLRKGVDVSTSQPSPTEVMDMWKEMLEEYEEIVYIPLSSGLSGSCMSAQAMANEEKFAGKVFVVDNGRVATPMHRSVLDAVEMVEKGYSGAEIKKILEETREKMIIYIGLSTLEYLKKGGRISSMTALAANVLNIKPVMGADKGVIIKLDQARGINKGLARMCAIAVKAAGDTAEKTAVIAHCNNHARAEQVRDELLKLAPFKEIVITETAGVATVYAGDGGIVLAI